MLRDDVPGFTAGAMWQDTQVGLSHLASWERIAVVCDADLLRKALHVLAWMIPGDVKTFELDPARDWVTASG